jgi:hypothetical protein
MKKTKLSTYFLFISIFTFLAVFFFIVQNSYDSLMKPINQVQTSDLIKPVDPHLDTSVLDQITSRQYYSSELTPSPATSSSSTP